MEKINLSNGTVIENAGPLKKRYVTSFLVFEIINGDLKLAETDRFKVFKVKSEAIEWIAECGDKNKTYSVQECYQPWEAISIK